MSPICKNAGVASLASDTDILLDVKACLPSGIKDDKLRSFVEVAVFGTEQNVVTPIAAIKFPGSLEQLEELADNILFRSIRNDTYHRPGSSAKRRYGLLVRPKPFLKNHQAKQDFMIVFTAGGMLLEEFADRSRAKVTINVGAAVKEGPGHSAIHGTAKPIIHDLDSKPSFRSLQNRIGEIGSADLAV
jgi:hypothetical protein